MGIKHSTAQNSQHLANSRSGWAFCYTAAMLTTTQRQPAHDINLERRRILVMRAWEAVSTERELQGVLEAITQVLVPEVPYDGVAIISFDGMNHDCYAAHIVCAPRHEGETLREYFDRLENGRPVVELPARPLIPYDFVDWGRVDKAAAYTCNDLFAKEGWYEHEFGLAAAGIRAYASIPMIVREKMIGKAAFSRITPMAFTDGDLAILRDISRALAVAVANALANEEIRQLRDQLEQENIIIMRRPIDNQHGIYRSRY
jgi:GAF domain-containing protein